MIHYIYTNGGGEQLEINYDLFMTRLFAKAAISGTPLAGSFELTNRCCLDCRMCYIHRNGNDFDAIAKEKDTSWWLDIAKKAQKSGMLILLLTGGEPLLRHDFDEIYLECVKMGLLVSVNTNGMLIDDEKIRLFKENPPQRLNITLYGTTVETYGELCGNAGAYEKVMTALKKLKRAGVNVKLNFSMVPYNKKDAPGVYEIGKELGFPVQPVSYMFPPVRSSGEAVRMTAEEAAEAQFKWQKNHLGDDDFRKYIENFKNNRSFGEINDECGEKISCRAALSTFWVTWDGKMTPCGMMTEPSVSISDFDAAWKEIRAQRENIMLPPECSACEHRKYCDICAAVSKAETGKFCVVPEYACKKAQEYHRLCNNFIHT